MFDVHGQSLAPTHRRLRSGAARLPRVWLIRSASEGGIQGGSGHLRVRVADGSAQVEYVLVQPANASQPSDPTARLGAAYTVNGGVPAE